MRGLRMLDEDEERAQRYLRHACHRRMLGGRDRRSSGGGGPYNFAAYATPSLRLRGLASEVTVVGLGVDAWTDRAGNWTARQTTDADRPALLGGGGGVDFDVANTECIDLDGGTIGVPTMTLFLDINVKSTGALRFLLDLNGAGGRFIFALGGSSDLMGFFDGAHRAVAVATTGRQKLTFVYAGGAPGVGEIFRNGVSLGTVATGTITPGLCNGSRISEATTAATAYCDATIHHLVLYLTASLTAPQRADIEAHL